MKEKVNIVQLPTYTKLHQGVPAEHAKDAIIKMIEQIGFEQTYTLLKKEGLQLCVGVRKNDVTQELAIVPKMKPVYILENSNLNTKNRYHEDFVFFNIGFGNEQLLLNAVLKTIPKKYTGVTRTENLQTVGDFLYNRVNEFVTIKNKENEKGILKAKEQLLASEKTKEENELRTIQEYVNNLLKNWKELPLETTVTYWRSGNGLIDTTQVYIYQKLQGNGRINLHFVLMGSKLGEIQMYYQVFYRKHNTSTKIKLSSEQESVLSKIFNTHFLKNKEHLNDFANIFAEKMYAQNKGLTQNPNFDTNFFVNQAKTSKYKIMGSLDSVDYSKLHR